jgi:branched-chain amino acid transport system substrate-binding protein
MRSPHVSGANPTLDRRALLRIFGAVAAAGATAGLAAACSTNGTSNRIRQPSGLTVRIGLVVPSAGAFTFIGEEIKRGVELYLTSNGNVLGPHNVDLVTADEGQTVDSALAAVSGLLDQSVVAVVGVANPEALQPLSDLLNSRQVPLVAANSAPSTLTNALFVWRASSVLGDSGRSLASYARTLGATAYVMNETALSGRSEAEAFTAAFTDAGGTVVAPANTTDIAQHLATARGRRVDLVFAAYSGDDAKSVLQRDHDSGLAVPLLGAGSLTETIDLTTIGPLPPAVYTSMFYAADLDNDANRRFVTEYHGAHNAQPTGYAMAAYDSAAVLDRALALVPTNPTGAAVNTAFSKLGQIDSPRGTWTFNQTRSPQQKYYLRRLSLDGMVPANLLDTDLMVVG